MREKTKWGPETDKRTILFCIEGQTDVFYTDRQTTLLYTDMQTDSRSHGQTVLHRQTIIFYTDSLALCGQANGHSWSAQTGRQTFLFYTDR